MSIVFNLQHLQNYYDHHLQAIYVLVLFDWCHFVWNFPYGFIVHIFVFINGSIPMCWVNAVVSLTGSHSSPLGCLHFDCPVECISGKVLSGACGFPFPLCLSTSDHWHISPQMGWLGQRGCTAPPSSSWPHRPEFAISLSLLSLIYTSLACVTSLRTRMDKSYSL